MGEFCCGRGKASAAEMAISRRALIMGCNGVLGRSMVQHIRALDGWHVMGADVSSSLAIDDLEMIHLDPGSGWADKISATVEELPELDLVVNVAGGWAGGDVSATETLANSVDMWNMNLMSSLAAAHVGARCAKPDGLVVLTGALGAMDETPSMISYGIAKAAVHHLVISYPEGLPNGTEICAILPGVIDTPNNRAGMPNADFDSWTHPDVIAAEMCKWAEDEDRPSSGSLVQIHTHEGKTEFVHT